MWKPFSVITALAWIGALSLPAQTAKRPEGTAAFAVHVNNDGLILDPEGQPVPPAGITDDFAKWDVTPGMTIILLIDGPDSVRHLTPTIRAFGGKYPKIIVKHYQPGDKTGQIFIPAPTAQERKAAIAQAYPGTLFPLLPEDADVTALLASRAPQFQPGLLPPHVHYRYADNRTVADAAARLTSHLANGSADFWARAVLVQPGVWKFFQHDSARGRVACLRVHLVMPTAQGPRQLEAAVVRDAADIAAIDARVRELANAGGPAQVRAMTSGEMTRWWTFIAYDIAEPTLIAASGDGHHRLVVGFNRAGAAVVDDLDELPDLTNGRR